MGEMRLIEAVREGLREEMERDSSVFLIGQDIGVNGGVFRVTEGLQAEFGIDRVIDAPLAESGLVGVAIGAALNGMRPVVEIQFADFIFPAFNQLVSEAARMYYRTNGDYPVPMVIRAPYGGGVRGGLYHSQSVEAFFAHVPGLKVVMPSSPHDAKGLLKAAIRDDNPVLFFEHKLSYNTVRGEVPQDDYSVPIGEAIVRREGTRVSLISYGLSVHHCLEAAETLSAEGISCEVIDLQTVRPLDSATLLESVRKTGRACIVHEDNLTGGVGAEVAAIIAKDGFEYLDAPIQRVAAPDVPSFPYSPILEDALLPGPTNIVKTARELSAY
ncbi:MAG: alpha-ketoacid dehydrogenase subunit beta [Chloroflexota bacterium]|nr:alpha-ketoacid dehydrogenase subunit beta [Chloroflexota bacterium]MEC9290252.1 alpha-ketoacid dehydrogenase subunit beta [Chloroflexota bacterium]